MLLVEFLFPPQSYANLKMCLSLIFSPIFILSVRYLLFQNQSFSGSMPVVVSHMPMLIIVVIHYISMCTITIITIKFVCVETIIIIMIIIVIIIRVIIILYHLMENITAPPP